MKDNETYITIPRERFEQMERIIEDKQDTNIVVNLLSMERTYTFGIISNTVVHVFTEKVNANMDVDKIEVFEKAIKAAVEEVNYINNKQIKLLQKEIEEIEVIKKQWWYKLFN